MIYGVITEPAGGVAGGPDAGSLAYADFINGVYSVAEVAAAAADIIDRPDLIDGSGLNIDSGNPADLPLLIGDFLAAVLTCDWTAVLSFTEDDTGFMYPFYIQDAGSGALYVASDNTEVAAYDQPAGDPSREGLVSSIAARPTLRRIAFTRTVDRFSVSVNGSSVVTDGTDVATPTMTQSAFGGAPQDGYPSMLGHIAFFAIYPVMADVDLPALSTP